MDLPRKMGVSQPETMDFPERKLGNAGVYTDFAQPFTAETCC
jgi:hypothetical protein